MCYSCKLILVLGLFAIFLSSSDGAAVGESRLEPKILSENNLLKSSYGSEWISASSQIIKDYFQRMETFFDQLYQDIEDEYQGFSSKETMSKIKTSFGGLMHEGREALESVRYIVDEGKIALQSMNKHLLEGSKIKLDSLKKVMEDGRMAYNQTVTSIQSNLNQTLSQLQNSWAQLSLENMNRRYNTTYSSVKTAMSEMTSSYTQMMDHYLRSIHRHDPVCQSSLLTCPDGIETFTTDTCCSSLWLSIGAPLGLGNECWIDLNVMLQKCSVFSCYGVDNGHFDISDGCSYVPDKLLNYESCVIHDLCYITPGVTKSACDKVMEQNINTIYCNNVNKYERLLCSMRATVASKVLGWTDKYFVDAGLMRDQCHRSDSWLDTIWKYTGAKYF